MKKYKYYLAAAALAALAYWYYKNYMQDDQSASASSGSAALVPDEISTGTVAVKSSAVDYGVAQDPRRQHQAYTASGSANVE